MITGKFIKPGVLLSLFIVFLLGEQTKASQLNKIQTSVYEGRSIQLYSKDGNTCTSWKSSDGSIASVTGSGVVKGKKKGTVVISCKADDRKLRCVVNVRRKQVSRHIANKYANVWLNLLGAVESGGMVYGCRDYTLFAPAGNITSNEVACTAGAYQEYGECLRELLLLIREQYPYSFNGRDTAGIGEDLASSWDYYAVSPGSAKARTIQSIIGCNAGRFVQDIRAIELLDIYLDDAKALGITNLRCGMFMAQCEHLGGYSSMKRVVLRATNKNSLASLRVSLYKDRRDLSSSYQIGDMLYANRHESIYKWLKQYIPASAKIK